MPANSFPIYSFWFLEQTHKSAKHEAAFPTNANPGFIKPNLLNRVHQKRDKILFQSVPRHFSCQKTPLSIVRLQYFSDV